MNYNGLLYIDLIDLFGIEYDKLAYIYYFIKVGTYVTQPLVHNRIEEFE